MGNCNRKEFVDDDNDNDKMLKELEKIKNRTVDPIIEIIEKDVPGKYIKDMAHFRDTYRIKKNFKCHKDLIYRVKVLENIRSGRLFNVKIIRKSDIMMIGLDNFRTLFYNEIRVFETFKHPGVETLINVYYDQTNEDIKIFIVTSYAQKNSLYDIVNKYIAEKKRFEDKEISIIMKLLIEICYKLKTCNILYRNFSLENIFFVKESNLFTMSVRNFYFSTFLSDQLIKGISGSMWYMAPEMLKDLSYDSKVDVWSLGVILYMLLTLDNPFSTYTTKEELLFGIKSGKCFRSVRELKKLGINSDCLNLMNKMLVEDPMQRISIEMILDDPLLKSIEKFSISKAMFKSFIDYSFKDLLTLRMKIDNLKKLHDIIFNLIYHLKDYFLDIEELTFINEFFKYFDKNNDGQISLIEIRDQLLQDGFENKLVYNYSNILFKIIDTDFRKGQTSAFLVDLIDYDFFVVANIIPKLLQSKNAPQSQRKVEIMFYEMDVDKSGTVSIDEIQSFFVTGYQKNIQNELEEIRENELFNNKNIDFDNLELTDLKDLFFYEWVGLSDDQHDELKKTVIDVKKGIGALKPK